MRWKLAAPVLPGVCADYPVIKYLRWIKSQFSLSQEVSEDKKISIEGSRCRETRAVLITEAFSTFSLADKRQCQVIMTKVAHPEHTCACSKSFLHQQNPSRAFSELNPWSQLFLVTLRFQGFFGPFYTDMGTAAVLAAELNKFLHCIP